MLVVLMIFQVRNKNVHESTDPINLDENEEEEMHIAGSMVNEERTNKVF